MDITQQFFPLLKFNTKGMIKKINIKGVLLLVLISNFGLLFAQESEAVWRYQTGGRVYSSPAIAGEKVIIGSSDSCLYAFDKADGKVLWKFKTEGAVHSSPAVNDAYVFFSSTDGNLYAVDHNTGSFKWKFSSNGEKAKDIWDYYLSSPKLAKGLVFWGSADSSLYAVEQSTGVLKWKFKAEDIIHATPEIDGDTLYIGDFNGNLFVLNINDGKLIWSFRTVGDRYFPKGEIQKGVSVDDNSVYFGSRDYNIYAVNKRTGRGVWNLKEGSWVISTPSIHKKMIFYGTSDTHEFVCLDKFSGKKLWKVALPMRVYSSAVVIDDFVYFGCFDGILRGADVNTGEIMYEYQTRGSRENYSKVFGSDGKFKPGFELYGNDYLESERLIHTLGSILSTPAVDKNIIYFGSSDGGVYAAKVITK